jgi:hypothetical protein
MRRLMMILATAIPAAALAASGEIAFVAGQVSLAKANGQRSTPAKGMAVDPGDTIVTGADGMVQLTMVDQARLSLRPNSQFVIEHYPDRRDSSEGAVLSLVRGTLRAFTGLLTSATRDKYVMKTRIATVGIRGSGNILHYCDGTDCDESLRQGGNPNDPITVNHTIEGSHEVTNKAGSLVTGPGQTVLVQGDRPPRYIPTPSFIANQGITMAGNSRPAQGDAGSSAPPRVFAPSDLRTIPPIYEGRTLSVGGNGLGFQVIDASGNLGADPFAMQDVVVAAASSPFVSQVSLSNPGNLALNGTQLLGYTAYEGLQSGVVAVIGGGTLQNASTVNLGSGESIHLGRTQSATFGLFGSGSPVPGSVHWAYGPSGFPPYFSDILTGTATYALAGATNPTNQDNVVGSLGSATLNVNFTNRTLNLGLNVSIPAAGANAGGQWQLSATGVPFAGNSFYASTADRLIITRGNEASSQTNPLLAGSIDGSFLGRRLNGAIVGYGISDQTSAASANWNFVSGVAAFNGPDQDPSLPYREGRVSDLSGPPSPFIQSYATTDRADEVVMDTQNRVTSFTAPFGNLGSHATYSLGTAQVVQSGMDPETGLVWGRWGNGTATASANGQTQSVNLSSSSLHYIFAGAQSGPVSLPLTGTAIYDIIGSTSPTDGAGHAGTLNSAALNVNFSTRRLDASVNLGINGQTWNGAATNVPIYRDQYFSAYSGTPVAGLPNPGALIISCTPSCGANATGSLDGFFTGRTGERAGMIFNLGGNQGAVAFGRRGG